MPICGAWHKEAPNRLPESSAENMFSCLEEGVECFGYATEAICHLGSDGDGRDGKWLTLGPIGPILPPIL